MMPDGWKLDEICTTSKKRTLRHFGVKFCVCTTTQFKYEATQASRDVHFPQLGSNFEWLSITLTQTPQSLAKLKTLSHLVLGMIFSEVNLVQETYLNSFLWHWLTPLLIVSKNRPYTVTNRSGIKFLYHNLVLYWFQNTFSPLNVTSSRNMAKFKAL